jgi:DNA-directed RNA polymerase specialized sigma subunit
MSDVDFGQLDETTAKQLIASYMPVVRALARMYPTHTRDDLVAVGRVAILEGYLSHEPDRSAQAWWIGRVVRWRLNAQAQREQRSNAGELHEEQLPAPPMQAVPSHLDLSALSANQRVVIQGRLADHTFRQIARNTGWSLRSVFRLYESACEKLRKDPQLRRNFDSLQE